MAVNLVVVGHSAAAAGQAGGFVVTEYSAEAEGAEYWPAEYFPAID